MPCLVIATAGNDKLRGCLYPFAVIAFDYSLAFLVVVGDYKQPWLFVASRWGEMCRFDYFNKEFSGYGLVAI